jgi:alkaline phosphatase
MSSVSFTRRQALKIGAGAALGAASLPLTSVFASETTAGSVSKKPKNIIFMVADGMSAGVPVLAESFSRLIGKGETHWHALARQAGTVHGFFDMASLNSLVTDSSAASSSWGSGTRITNHSINVLPNDVKLVPIAQSVKESGRKMGLVTTVTVTHATPAGFAAAVEDRNDEINIAPQYLDLVDVIMGGGLKFFDAKLRKDGRDLTGEFAKAGYSFLNTRDQVLKASPQPRILGLFDPHYLPYTVDQNNNPALLKGVPTLAEMSTLALRSLSQHPGGFLLQIEGGRVDGAAHANDPAALVWDQLAFDAAIGVVLDFVKSHSDTLVIITTDHGNSNPGLIGMGSEYAQSNACFAKLKDFRVSTALMQSDLQQIVKSGKSLKPEDVLACVKAGTGLTLSPEECQALVETFTPGFKSKRLGNQQHNGFVGLLGEFTGNYTGIGWTGTTHTSDYAPILAIGPGAEAFSGVVLNTDAYVHLTAYMGVTHKNPSMTPEEATKFKKPLTANLTPHWQYVS